VRKEESPMIKKVATVLKYTSESGLPLHIAKRIMLAQFARQTRNRRKVTFSNMTVITLFMADGFLMRKVVLDQHGTRRSRIS
jgi:hypothetical protein